MSEAESLGWGKEKAVLCEVPEGWLITGLELLFWARWEVLRDSEQRKDRI